MDMNNVFSRLDEMFEAKEFKTAEMFLKKNMAEAEKEGDYSAVISICNELGGYYRTVSRYDESISLYEKALELIEKLGLNSTEHHGTTLINYGTACTMAGDTRKALELYDRAAEIFSGEEYAEDYRLAALYNNMSSLCRNMGDSERAENCLQNALRILQTLGGNEIEIAVTYTNLTNVYLTMGRLDDAAAAAEKALDIFAGEKDGEKDVHYAAAVCAYGEVCFREGDNGKALHLFKNALELTERDYGSDNMNCCVILSNMAQCEAELGMKEESLMHAGEASAIRERVRNERS